MLERWRDELPTLSRLADQGSWGRLTSIIPPITVPAWSCMMASRTPGDLGVYGFRNRSDHSYGGLFIANGAAIKAPRLWDLVTRAGSPSIVLGVPGTYPPRPLNGVLVSCFLTPSIESSYTYPPMLRREIESTVGEYLFDCPNFRTDDKEDLLAQVYDMTEQPLCARRAPARDQAVGLFAMVEMGPDRMHHGFWKFMDPEHRKHEPGNPFEDAILAYHRRIDELVARLLEHADEDTAVLVVPTTAQAHGRRNPRKRVAPARKALAAAPLRRGEAGRRRRRLGADSCLGRGGYYARVFMNVRGREPEGTVDPEQYEQVRDDLAARLAAIPDEQGRPIGTKVFSRRTSIPR